MSAPLLLLLKADPSLEGDVAYDKADPSATVWLFNFFLLERTMKQELQKRQKGPRGI